MILPRNAEPPLLANDMVALTAGPHELAEANLMRITTMRRWSLNAICAIFFKVRVEFSPRSNRSQIPALRGFLPNLDA